MRVYAACRTCFSWAAVLALLLSVSGCANSPPKQAFNHEANAAIKRIDVLPIRPSELSVFIANNPGFSFGLVGALIVQANLSPKNEWLRTTVQREHFDQNAVFRDRLTQAFAAKGYELQWPAAFVEDEKAQASRDRFGQRQKYAPSVDGNAQLDVSFGFVGYAAGGPGNNSQYRPTVYLTARLVSADGKNVLMADRVVYNTVFPGGDGITVNADPAYAYPEFDALRAADAKAVEGLRVAFEAVADELAKQF